MIARYEEKRSSLFESALVGARRTLQQVSAVGASADGAIVKCGSAGAMWTIKSTLDGPDWVEIELEPFTDVHSLPLNAFVFELPMPS